MKERDGEHRRFILAKSERMIRRTQQMRKTLGVGLGLGRLLLGRLLKARVAARCELVLELLDAASRIDVLQLSCEEWVAHVADIDLQLTTNASRREGISTTTGDCSFNVFWVDAVLHVPSPCGRILTKFCTCRNLRNRNNIIRGKSPQAAADLGSGAVCDS